MSSHHQLNVPQGGDSLHPEEVSTSGPPNRRRRRWFDVLTSSASVLVPTSGEARHAPLPQHDEDDHNSSSSSHHCSSNKPKSDGDAENSTCSSTSCSSPTSMSYVETTHDETHLLHLHHHQQHHAADIESQPNESLLVVGLSSSPSLSSLIDSSSSSFESDSSSAEDGDDESAVRKHRHRRRHMTAAAAAAASTASSSRRRHRHHQSPILRLPFRRSTLTHSSSSSSLLTVDVSSGDHGDDSGDGQQRVKHTHSAVSSRAAGNNKKDNMDAKRHCVSKSTTTATTVSTTSSCSTTEHDEDVTSRGSSSSSNSSLHNKHSVHHNDDRDETEGIHIPRAAKLVFGGVGIYTAYLIYGHYQEDLFSYRAPTAAQETFQAVWLLQTFESFVNMLVGAAGRFLFVCRRNPNNRREHEDLHVKSFLLCGVAQLFAKGFTSAALAAGLSFPVAILCKSAKIVPVMVGSLVLGQSRFKFRDYLFAALVVSGTAMLTAGSKKSDNTSSSTPAGLICIAISLVADGVTGGLQKRLLRQYEADGNGRPSPFDFMFYTNLAMTVLAVLISTVLTDDFSSGIQFLQDNPVVVRMIVTCCICSAVGQSFVFYVVATFDPVVCATLTTTRKILSVLWSVLSKGHILSAQGNVGLSLAFSGLLIEVHNKATTHSHDDTAITGNVADTRDGATATGRGPSDDDEDADRLNSKVAGEDLQSISKTSTASMSSQDDDDDDDDDDDGDEEATYVEEKRSEAISIPILTVC